MAVTVICALFKSHADASLMLRLLARFGCAAGKLEDATYEV